MAAPRRDSTGCTRLPAGGETLGNESSPPGIRLNQNEKRLLLFENRDFRQVAALTDRQLAALTDRQVAALSDHQVTPLTDRQVAALTDRQVAALTDRQVAALSDRQVTALTDWQVTAWFLSPPLGDAVVQVVVWW